MSNDESSPDSNEDALYQAACAVERDDVLTAEMREWEATVADGLEPWPVEAPHIPLSAGLAAAFMKSRG